MSGTTGNVETDAQLLNEDRDGQNAGAITPQNIRNIVASETAHLKATVGWYSAKNYGAIGDGGSHPASANGFATLAALQAVYPFATALTNEMDWLGAQAAINAASGGGCVVFPAGIYRINLSLLLPTFNNDYDQAGIELRGDGINATTLRWDNDLGAGHFAIYQSNRQATSSTHIRDMQLLGPGTTFTMGQAPANMSGIAANSRWSVMNVRTFYFYAGIDVQADHSHFDEIYSCNNYYGCYFSAGSVDFGDQCFIRCDFAGNTMSSFATHPAGCFADCTFVKVHTGYGPYCWYREAQSTLGGYTNRNMLTNCVLYNVSHEQVGNAVFAAADGNTNTNAGYVYNQIYGDLGLSFGDTYKIAATTRQAAIQCSHFFGNYIVGYPLCPGFSYTPLSTAFINVFALTNNRFIGASALIAGGTTQVPFAIAATASNNIVELETDPLPRALIAGANSSWVLGANPLPTTASTSTLGLVKPDGSTITIDGNGVIRSGAGAGGAVLATAVVPYNGTASAYTASGVSGTSADVDATNLIVTFVAPSTGAVDVTLSACGYTTGSAQMLWSLRDSSTSLDIAQTHSQCQITTTSSSTRYTYFLRVTGLTSGTTYTWKWGYASSTTSSVAFIQTGGVYGVPTMEIRSA